ncbi:MAG: phage major capsid protein [Thermoplasmata archaeon]
MPIEQNAFTTQSTGAQYVNPEFWSDKLVKKEKERTFLETFANKDYRALGKNVTSIKIPKNSYIEASAITEGQEIPVSEVNYGSVEVTFNWYGAAFQVTLQELQSSFEFVMEDLVDRLSYALAAKKEKVIANTLISGAGVTHQKTNDLLSDIIDLQKKMRDYSVVPKYLIVSTDYEAALKKVLIENGSIILQEGLAEYDGVKIGRLLGMDVYSSAFLPSGTVLMLAEGAFVVAYQQEAKLQKGAPNARSLWIDFAAFEAYGVAVLDDKKVGKLTN